MEEGRCDERMMTKLGQVVLERLAILNVSRKELGTRLGVTESTVSHYIKGDRDPKPEMLIKMAEILEVTTDYLLGVETDAEFNYNHVRKILANNAKSLTDEQKRKLIDAVFGKG